MSRPYWRARHIETRALLPNKLERGRAYFVDDEQIIIIDHGNGPIEYGGRPGPQGIAGEPIPSLQGQIDSLAEASLRTTLTIKELNDRRKADSEQLQNMLAEIKENVLATDANNAAAILSIINLIMTQEQKHDSEIAIITKAITNLYPTTHTAQSGDGSNDTTDGEIIIAADGNAYLIEQSYTENGTGVVVLSFYDKNTRQRISTLNTGDSVIIDSLVYTVTDTDADKGSITLTVFQS